MENTLERLQELELRTRRLEAHLRRWRVAALVLGLGALAVLYVHPGQAQQGGGPGTTINAPLIVRGATGQTILDVREYNDRTNNSLDTMLTLYKDGQPAALFRTTGKTYKDASDPAENYLSLIETWLYHYSKDPEGRTQPVPCLAASTALTRAGGSIVVFSDQGKSTTTPPLAARLTAKRGTGGTLILYNTDGTEAKEMRAK